MTQRSGSCLHSGANGCLPPEASLRGVRLPEILALTVSTAYFFVDWEDQASGRPWKNHEMNKWAQFLTVCKEHSHTFVLSVRIGQVRPEALPELLWALDRRGMWGSEKLNGFP